MPRPPVGTRAPVFGNNLPPRASWRPVYAYVTDPEFGHKVRRTVGYRGVCDCGDQGPIEGRVYEARNWAVAHEIAAHR